VTVLRHIASCDACADRLRVMRLLPAQLDRSGPGAIVARTLECPSDEEWGSLAPDFLGVSGGEALLEHATQCPRCASVLRTVMESLARTLSAEEEQLLQGLDSGTPEWRRDMARKLAQIADGRDTEPLKRPVAAAHPRKPILMRWPFWALAAATVVLAAGATVWTLRSGSSLSSVNQLIARAYTENRTLELRIPDAEHAKFQTNRTKPDASLTSAPKPLRAAATRIDEHLEEYPSDPDWLLAKGRANLVGGFYQTAVEYLERARELQPNSAEIKTDLASAYFERGGAGNSSDSGKAMELLGQALDIRPDSRVALFNRAIIAARLCYGAQSESDWTRYLELDPTGEWADEAREDLKQLRKSPPAYCGPAPVSRAPLFSPKVLGSLPPSGWNVADLRLEEYLDVVVRDWLPQAFPVNRVEREKSDEAIKAVGIVAQLAQAKHQDRWLGDLTAKSSGPRFREAVLALSHAIKAADRGDYRVSQTSADEADRLFRTSGNLPGSLRAQIQKVFDLHLSQDGEACLAHADPVRREIDGYRYSWLKIQSRLEQAACLSMMGSLGQAEQMTNAALQMSKDHRYPILMLRAIGLSADTDLAIGDVERGWKRSYEGLGYYWAGSFPPMQGYNLYTNLDTAADLLDRPHLQLAIWREALSLIDTDEDTLLRAMAHSWAANAANMADSPALAEDEYAKADRLFREAPQTDATIRDHTEAQIWLARLKARRGASDEALNLLLGVQAAVTPLSNNYMKINFYSALGEVQLRRGSLEEAGHSLVRATQLAEQSLDSLQSEKERIEWGRECASAYRGLVDLELKRGSSRDGLELWEWYRSAAVRSRNHPHQGENASALARESSDLRIWRAVEEHLPDLNEETVISYAILPDGLAIWIYDDRGVTFQWSKETLTSLTATAKRFKTLCASPHSDRRAIGREGRALYDILLFPIQDRITATRTLVIEGDGPLSGLPFEALVDRDGRYLNERTAVTYSLGRYSSRRVGPRQEGISRNSSALVVAVPTNLSGDKLPALPDTLGEAEFVAGAFRNSHLLESDQATLQKVKEALPNSRVLHFAGHAVLSNGSPALVLADSDWKTSRGNLLNAQTLGRLHLQDTELAVLSACATEVGSEMALDDPDSLAHAFLSAGVPHVIATHWAIDSHTATIFMRTFYRELLSGKSAALSVRDAAVLIRAESTTSHPYYWCAYGSFGQE